MSRKTYLIVALALLVLSPVAVWLNDHDENAAKALMKSRCSLRIFTTIFTKWRRAARDVL